ncbi:MAG TPA: hypothetical protein VGU66_06770 [Candidatus Elarobacter sp.]|nr:hypothetical protein [Candidatus Elarobacter sp.]
MKYVVISFSFLSTLAMSLFALLYFPKIAGRLNGSLPNRPSRAGRLFLPPGGRYDSPENLTYVRLSAVVGIGIAAFLAVALVWWAVQDVGTALAAHR